jgi:hypothetical protein
MKEKKISSFLREALKRGKEQAFKPSRDYACSFRTQEEHAEVKNKFACCFPSKTK